MADKNIGRCFLPRIVLLAFIAAQHFSNPASAENQADQQFADAPWTTSALPDSLRVGKPTTQPVVANDGTVDASKTTGGFSAQAYNTAEIVVRWGPIKGATQLALCRSTIPKFKACYRNIVTDHAQDNNDPQDKSPNHWLDNSVRRNTRYYYILAAVIGNNCYIAATGSCATPAHDEFDQLPNGTQQSNTKLNATTNPPAHSAGDAAASVEVLGLTPTIHAIEDAIDRGDMQMLAGIMRADNDEDDHLRRYQADYMITNRAVEKGIVTQFPKSVADRLIQDLNLFDFTWGPDKQNRWYELDDIARPDVHFPERLHVPWDRMALINGKWWLDYCIPHPPWWRFAGRQDQALSQTKYLLANLKNCHTVTQVRILAGGIQSNRTPEDQLKNADRFTLANIAESQQWDFPGSDGNEQQKTIARTLNIWEEWSKSNSPAAIEAAPEYLYARHDDGTYAKARVRWIQAVIRLNVYASWELDAGVPGLVAPTEILSMPFGPEQFSIFGNTASADVDSMETYQTTTIHMRRINGQWKIDISKLAGSNPKSAARKLDAQTKKLQEITEQVKGDKFDDVEQLKQAIKDAGLPLHENPQHPAQ